MRTNNKKQKKNEKNKIKNSSLNQSTRDVSSATNSAVSLHLAILLALPASAIVHWQYVRPLQHPDVRSSAGALEGVTDDGQTTAT